MTERQAYALQLAGQLLNFPNREFMETLPELEHELQDLSKAEETMAFAKSALGFIEQMTNMSEAERNRQYVSIFDLTPKASLYMTWHRYGNDRSQGQALAALNGLYRTAGFEPVLGIMPDYLPRMLEFLSIAPDWACEALLDGFGPEMMAHLKAVKALEAPQAQFLEDAYLSLIKEFPAHFEKRKGPDPTKRPMAQPVPEPLEPIVPLKTRDKK